jgi:phosphate transporter
MSACLAARHHPCTLRARRPAPGQIVTYLHAASPWILTLELCAVMLLVASFTSHTVTAIVLMPLVASVGDEVGFAPVLVMCCALTDSAAMALPMSSFPNVNSLMAEDEVGRPYLAARDFVRLGVPASIMVASLIATGGYALSVALLGQ